MVDTRRWVGGGDQAVGGGGGVAAACGSRALPGLPRAPSLQVFSKSGLRVLLLLLGSLAPTFELETLSLALELKTRRAAIALPRPLPYSGSATVRRRHHLIMP